MNTKPESLFASLEDEWRRNPTDLSGWANRAMQMKQLAIAAQLVIDCYEEGEIRGLAKARDSYFSIVKRMS